LALHLLHLLFQPINALFRAGRRLPLGLRGHRHENQGGAGRESGGQTIFHDIFPTLRFGTQFAPPLIARR
jgi:hypothetical protein